jgi:hypothetical protein
VNPLVEAARRDFTLAYWGGASQEAVDSAARALDQARIEAETPTGRVTRLHREAADLDAEAERHLAAEADAAGRIAYCRSIGNHELADRLAPQQRSAASCAATAADKAFAKRLEAAEIETRGRSMVELRDAILDIAGAFRGVEP